MNSKLSALLKKVFLSSLAGIATNGSSYADEIAIENISSSSIKHANNKINVVPISPLTPKLILKLNNNNVWEVASHRSHRSHSSHRSHYSHYSSSSRGGGGSSGGSSSGSSGSSGYSGGTNSGLMLSSPDKYSLGSRVLKRGMQGSDVTELINLLLQKKYLKLEGGGTSVTGIYIFDEVVESAIEQFQIDNGLTSDGQVGPQTLYLLKN